jgi:hypothetical protein
MAHLAEAAPIEPDPIGGLQSIEEAAPSEQ